MTEQNTQQFLGITTDLADFHAAAANAILQSTNNAAEAAKITKNFMRGYGGLVNGGLTYHEIKSSSDPYTTAKAIGTKAAITLGAQFAGTVAFGWTGPAAPVFGMAVGAITSYGLDSLENSSGTTIYEGVYNVFDTSHPEIGELTTQIKAADGTVQLTIVQNTQTNEVRYIDPDLNVTKFALDSAGNYQSFEITKNGSTLGLDLQTGDFNVTDTNGVSHTGNLTDTSLSTAADAVISSMLDDFNAEIRLTEPTFDIYADIVNTVQGSSNDLAVEISGRKIIASDKFVIDSQNSYGGTTISYDGLSISTDSTGNVVVKTANIANGETRGIFYDSDGSKTVFYNDPNATDGVAEVTFTNVSQLSGDARYPPPFK